MHTVYSIWLINKTLSGANTPGQSWSESNGNKKALHIPQISRAGTSPSDGLLSNRFVCVWVYVQHTHTHTHTHTHIYIFIYICTHVRQQVYIYIYIYIYIYTCWRTCVHVLTSNYIYVCFLSTANLFFYQCFCLSLFYKLISNHWHLLNGLKGERKVLTKKINRCYRRSKTLPSWISNFYLFIYLFIYLFFGGGTFCQISSASSISFFLSFFLSFSIIYLLILSFFFIFLFSFLLIYFLSSSFYFYFFFKSISFFPSALFYLLFIIALCVRFLFLSFNLSPFYLPTFYSPPYSTVFNTSYINRVGQNDLTFCRFNKSK